MLIARPDITAELHKRDPSTKVFVISITNEFILGLDVMHAHDASVDLRRRVLQLSDEELPLWQPRARPLWPPCTKGNSEVVARYDQSCDGVGGRTPGCGG
jgi:hypothetical protein